jgi:hypothetical protein
MFQAAHPWLRRTSHTPIFDLTLVPSELFRQPANDGPVILVESITVGSASLAA